MNKTDKILITGHKGFVGSNLVNKLKKLGYKNLILLNNIDLKDEVSVKFAFLNKLPKIVIHCAAKVGGIQANINNPYSFLYDNLMIQNNIINSCLEYNITTCLFLGSSCIYPKNTKQPMSEEQLLTGELEKTNEGYALAKIAGLKLCEYANKLNKTKFISLMPSNLYGPQDNFDLETSHVIPALIRKIHNAKIKNKKSVKVWGTGEVKREFMYVDDLVNGIIWSLNNIDKTDTFLNIGTGKDISIFDLTHLIASIIDYKGKLVFDPTKPNGMLQKVLDTYKINSLGWSAKTSLKTGLQKTIKWYINKLSEDEQFSI